MIDDSINLVDLKQYTLKVVNIPKITSNIEENPLILFFIIGIALYIIVISVIAILNCFINKSSNKPCKKKFMMGLKGLRNYLLFGAVI